MVALDFKSSRRRSPWRIITSARSVFGFSRSRSRAESRHDADYAMGLRRAGPEGEYDIVDERFAATTSAIAAHLRQSPGAEGSGAEETEEKDTELEDVQASNEYDMERGRKTGDIPWWLPPGAATSDPRGVLIQAMRGNADQGTHHQDTEPAASTNAAAQPPLVFTHRRALFTKLNAPRLIQEVASAPPLPSISESQDDKLWHCCQCGPDGMIAERSSACLLCGHWRCEECPTLAMEDARTNRFTVEVVTNSPRSRIPSPPPRWRVVPQSRSVGL